LAREFDWGEQGMNGAATGPPGPPAPRRGASGGPGDAAPSPGAAMSLTADIHKLLPVFYK
jgi:hypothetical protein